jgi:general secretion pathway protein A
MYVEHFGLQERTFTNGPATGYFSPNPQVQAAVARIRQTLLARDSVAVITGGPGVGKSAIVADALASVEDQTIVAHIDLRQTNPDLLYDMLLLDLGADISDGNEANSLHRLHQVICEHNQDGRKVTAVIDMPGMTIERAKRILQLVHMAGEPGGQLNFILLGPHNLHKMLNAPGLIHLRQRVCFRYRVRPFTAAEADAYIGHQFSLAGGDADSVLEEGISNDIFRFAGGVPRLINTLIDSALSEACIREDGTVSRDLVKTVTKELGWRPLTSSATPARKAAPAVAAAAPTPKPVELSLEAPAPEPAAASQTAHDASGKLDVSSLLADPVGAAKPLPGADSTLTAKDSAPAASAPIEPLPSTIPLMDANDTSATGMLRLEDLDARFAETIFGDDDAADAAKAAQEQGVAG